MKFLFSAFLGLAFLPGVSQTLQMHYDLRHSVDPKNNPKNYPELYFEFFKTQDSGKAFIKPGSFLLKAEADLLGEGGNIGKFYLQVSQSFRFWQPKIFLNLQYSGGLGVTEPKQYSYYIPNTYSFGLNYPFKWGNCYLSAVLNYQYVPYKKPTMDGLFTLYWWKGLWNYHAEISGDFSIWTANRDHGDSLTLALSGKEFFFYAEPQFWFHINKVVALGTKIVIGYHVYAVENVLNLYPTIAIRCKI